VDIVCFSHLRWQFVYQRPNHLMARAARRHRVHFIEEPETGAERAGLRVERRDGLEVVTPLLPAGLKRSDELALRRSLLARHLGHLAATDTWLWYYTPMALLWTESVAAAAVVYDCMDELSAFRGAPPGLRRLEKELLARADVLFTGGRSLYEAKRSLHPSTHLFPSSVDVKHFGRARQAQPEPADQATIARPRIGYFGVIDERLDLDLLTGLAQRRPSWQIVMVGPLAKLGEADLPRAGNIHWLGLKPYAELPAYLAGWDVAIMPFAINEATRFISPTKTPEYLAGGRPVVSTPVRDVVQPYGDAGLVTIAPDVEGFVEAVEQALTCDRSLLLRRADQLLERQSWDRTWSAMEQLVTAVHRRRLSGAGAPAGWMPEAATVSLSPELAGAALRSAGSAGGGSTSGPRLTRARSR